jgi:hypothetical protein
MLRCMIDTATMSPLSPYDANYVSVSVVPWMARLSLRRRGIVLPVPSNEVRGGLGIGGNGNTGNIRSPKA